MFILLLQKKKLRSKWRLSILFSLVIYYIYYQYVSFIRDLDDTFPQDDPNNKGVPDKGGGCLKARGPRVDHKRHPWVSSDFSASVH